MHPRDPFDRAGWAAWGILALLLLILPAACHVTQASSGAVTFTPPACKSLVEMLEQSSDARSAGIPGAAYLKYLSLRMHRTNLAPPARAIVLRELARVWTSGHPPEALTLDLYTRCMTGPLGGEET